MQLFNKKEPNFIEQAQVDIFPLQNCSTSFAFLFVTYLLLIAHCDNCPLSLYKTYGRWQTDLLWIKIPHIQVSFIKSITYKFFTTESILNCCTIYPPKRKCGHNKNNDLWIICVTCTIYKSRSQISHFDIDSQNKERLGYTSS